MLHLALLSDEEKTEFFQRAFSSGECTLHRFAPLELFTEREFYFLAFPLTPMNADAVVRLALSKTDKQKILLCNKIDDAALSLCERLGIDVKTGEWVYRHLKEQSLLPENYLGEALKLPKRKVKLWFSKNNAKRFLVGGAMVLFLAQITPFYYYYLLVGCLLLLTAILVRVFGYE